MIGTVNQNRIVTVFSAHLQLVRVFPDHLSLDEIVLQPGETCGARLVSFSEMEEMIRRGEVALPVANRFRDFRDQLLSLYRQIRK